ncbi:MAG: hypothetical protein II508_04780 [Acholeplasmatales bacterium]|jgi:cytochrome c biogenesis protein CcdA|nr:hypothetical protein [Acholeplasmatales bacterium]MBQ4357708.1 hypothetical protein [Acholeplasmatales bacterium]
MTKEEMKIYADKYRKTQKVLYKVFSVLIFFIALLLFTVAILLIVNANNEIVIYVVGGVMILLGIADIFVAIRFIKHSKIRFKNISDMDAAKAYCKIHGFDSKIEEKK